MPSLPCLLFAAPLVPARMAAKRLISSIGVLALTASALGVVASGCAATEPPPCHTFPRSNPWNQRIDQLPVASGSRTLIEGIGLEPSPYPDLTVPYTTVGSGQRKVPVSFSSPEHSDRGPYAIPPDARIESGVDRHVIVVDREDCRLYELYDAHSVSGGSRWRAYSGAIWNMRSNRVRPKFWGSADAAGLPIFPGLLRFDEVQSGEIDHAIRFTAEPRRTFVYPARNSDGDSSSPRLPPMGTRVRLKASFDVSRFPPQSRVILRALQRYGMILADTGDPWVMTGAPSSGWDRNDLESLDRVEGRDFEVVDSSLLPRPRD
jgi:hypothetical protein